MRSFRSLLAAASAIAFTLQGCAATPADDVAVTTPAVESSGPALWRVADEDTTVYLFGTVHALPEDVQWYRGPVENALTGSDVLVTEIPLSAMKDPASQQIVTSLAGLPAGQSLRAMLSDEQRASYEAALGSLSLPPAAFDRFEPWFAAITLSVLPLIQNGWSPEMGVENVIDQRAGPDKERAALETLGQQMSFFDEMPQDAQVDYLMAVVDQMDQILPMMDRMVDEWAEGDAASLASLMNDNMDDATVAEVLLYNRNANWAEWIDSRLDQPGTVFIAVGAGHLAGTRSVQDYLGQRGIEVTRVQ
ncbi:TraB/GumN family protein [Erythrobacter litoralis]|uniref:TraB/GumN family protein n=1 Tax=Erythrobacter litoralis TaxID=39960 RepID=UPI00243560B8|nr:TraB/GumN family protein [Erythrobacter litoralis]MDG6079554.1 TraB/GumN family protein [Erythrobacter litoralis]